MAHRFLFHSTISSRVIKKKKKIVIKTKKECGGWTLWAVERSLDLEVSRPRSLNLEISPPTL